MNQNMKVSLEDLNDKEVVLEAVKQNGYSLEYASEELKNNKEVVLEAVKQNGYSLHYASEELKNNKEVVLEAIKQNGNSLCYASEELKNNKEVVWISNGYFKLIKSIKTFDLNFKFSKNEIEKIFL
jgi:CxxC motif-containing protein